MIAKGFGPPLRHPAVAGALYLPAIAVLGEDRLADIGPGEIVGEEFVYDDRDGVEDVALRDPFVVEGCGGSDGKVIALIAVAFRVYAVQGKGHDGQHICTDGTLRARWRRSRWRLHF